MVQKAEGVRSAWSQQWRAHQWDFTLAYVTSWEKNVKNLMVSHLKIQKGIENGWVYKNGIAFTEGEM